MKRTGKTRNDLLIELEELQRQVSFWKTAATGQIQIPDSSYPDRDANQKSGIFSSGKPEGWTDGRNCSCRITRFLGQPGQGLEEVTGFLLEAIPEGMQHPELVRVQVILGSERWGYTAMEELPHVLSADIQAQGVVYGLLRLGYLSDQRIDSGRPFLPEEEGLPGLVAGQLGRYLHNRDREERLRIQEDRFRLIIESSNEVFYEISPDGVIQYISPVVERHFGYSAAEMTGQSFLNFVHPDDREEVVGSLNQLPAVILPSIEYRVVAKSGDWVWVRSSASPMYRDGILVGISGSVSNISEQKQMEGDLRYREALYHSIIQSSPDVIVITDFQGNILHTSPNAGLWFGFPAGHDFRGEWLLRFLSENDRPDASEKMDLLRHGIRPGVFEYQLFVHEGVVFYVEVNGDFIRNEQGEVDRMVFVIRNITERRVMERKLHEREALSAKILNSINDLVYEVSEEGLIRYLSPSVEQVLGYKPEELLGTSFVQLVFPEDADLFLETLASHTGSDTPPFDYRCIHCSGEIRWLRTSPSQISLGDGTFLRIGTLTDITDRKMMEMELQRSEAMHRSILAATPDLITIFDAEGNLEYLSPRFASMFGRANSVPASWSEFLHCFQPASQPGLKACFHQLLHGQVPLASECVARTSDGQSFDVEVVAEVVRGEAGGPQKLLLVTRDIRHRKAVEGQLAKARDMYQDILESIHDVVFEVLVDGTIAFVSPAIRQILGMVPEDVIGRNFMEFIHPEDRQVVTTAFTNLAWEDNRGLEYRYINSEGQTRWVQSHTTPFFVDGKLTGGRGILSDIQKRKEAEIGLVESESRHRKLFETMEQGVFYHNSDLSIIQMNPSARRILGLTGVTNLDEGVETLQWEFFREDGSSLSREDLPHLLAFHNGQVVTNMVVGVKNALLSEPVWLLVNSERDEVSASGPGFQILTTFADITELRRREQAILQSETKYRLLLENLPAGVVVHHSDSHMLFANSEALGLLGITRDQAEGRAPFHPDWYFTDQSGHRLLPDEYPVSRIIRSKEALCNQIIGIHRPLLNDQVWVQVSGYPEKDAEGQLSQIVLSFINITERQNAQEKLRTSELKYRLIFESIQDVYYEAALDGRILEISPSINHLTGGQYHREDLIGASLWDFYAFPEAREAFLNQIVKTSRVVDYEIVLKNRDGSLNPVAISTSLIYNPEGQAEKVVGSIRDIRERKAQEALLRSSEARIRTLFELVPVGLVMIDQAGKVLFCNPAFSALTGYTLEEVGDIETWFMVAYPDPDYRQSLRNQWQADIQKMMVGAEKLRPAEARITTRQGEERWVEISFEFAGEFSMVTLVDVNQRRADEQKIRESQELLKNLVNSQSNYVVRTDLLGRYTYWNQKMVEEFGWICPDGNFEAIPVMDTIAAHHHDRAWQATLQCLEEPGRIVQVELDKPRQNGGFLTIIWEFVCLTDSSGAPTGVQCIGIDITQRRKAEQDLQNSHERLMTVLNSIEAFIYIADMESHELIFVNEYGKKTWGGEGLEKTLCYKTLQGFNEPCSFCNNSRLLDENGEPGPVIQWEFQNKMDNRWYDLRDRAIRWTDGRLVRLEIATDITLKKKAELEIRGSEERYRSLIESSDASILMVDARGTFLFLNQMAAVPYQLPPDQIIGKSIQDLLPDDASEAIQKLINRVLEANQGLVLEEEVDFAGETTYFRTSLQPVRDGSGQAYAVLRYATDITEMRKAQIRINLSEKKYRSLFDESPLAYLILQDGRFVECNKAASVMIGGDRLYLLQSTPAELSPEFQPGGYRSASHAAEKIREGFEKGTTSFEWVHVRKDGTEFMVIIHASLIDYEDRPALLCTWQDITEKKRQEEEIRKLSQAVEQSPVSIVITNLDGNIEYANPKATETTGYTLEELKGQNPRVLKSGVTPNQEYKFLWDSITQGKEWKGIFHNRRKNGEMYWESSVISPILDAQGQPTHYIAVKEDITERRNVWLALQESQNRFMEVAEQSQTVVWEIDLEGRYTYVNELSTLIWGYGPEELVGKKQVFDLHPSGAGSDFREEFLALTSDLREMIDLEHPLKRKDGESIWVSTNGKPFRDEKGRVIGYRGSDINITEGRRSREELKRFRVVSDQANYGTAIAGLDGCLLYVNDAFARMHGWTSEDLTMKHLSALHTEDQMRHVQQYIGDILEKGGIVAQEVWRVRKDGLVFPSLMNASLIRDEKGRPSYMSASVIDISKIKQAESALRQSEEALNFAQKLGGMGSWELDVSSQQVQLSRNMYPILGISTVGIDTDKPLDNSEFLKRIFPEDQKLIQSKLDEMLQTRQPVRMELRMVRDDGALVWLENNITPVFEGETLAFLKGAAIDITSKKAYENAIKEQNDRLGAIISANPDMVFVMDREGTYLEYYSQNDTDLPVPRNGLIGVKLGDLFGSDSIQNHLQRIQTCLEKQTLVTYEYSVMHEGQEKYFEVRMAPMGPDKVLRFVRNFTDRVQTEKEITRLSLAVEQSPVSIVITDLEGRIEYINPAFIESTGYTREELIGEHTRLLKSGKTDPAIYEAMWRTISVGKVWHGEWVVRKKNGAFFWETVSITPIFDSRKQIINYLAVKQDITEKKQAEQEILELNASLETKVEQRTGELISLNNNLQREIEERIQVEEALQLKTKELENFFDVALDLLSISDTSGNFVKLNRIWENVLGWSLNELYAHNHLDFVHPDDLEPTHEILHQLRNQSPLQSFVNRYRTASGEYRFLEWRSTPIGDKVYSAARDITDRMRAAEFDSQLLQVSTQLSGIGAEEVDPAIELALRRIGLFLDVDRSYLFLFNTEAGTMSNSHEWCAEGISPEIDNLQDLPLELFPVWMEKITRNMPVLIPSVASLDESWGSLKEDLSAQGILSLIAIPLLVDGEAVGFLGLDSVKKERLFSENEISTLKVWSTLVSSLLTKKRNDEIVQQVRWNYENFFNTIDDFLWVTDLEGNIVHVNQTVVDRLDYVRDALIGQSLLMAHPPRMHDEARVVIMEMISGKTNMCTLPLNTRSGWMIPVETRIKQGFWDNQPAIFGVSKDISKIQLSEQKFSSAFESNAAMMAISYFDDDRYMDVNHEFMDVLGFDRAELLGQSARDLALFVDPDQGAGVLDRLKESLPIRKKEILMRTRDGSIRTGLLSADAIVVGDRKCLLTVTMDITERKKAEVEILRARMEAEQANLAKSEFLSRMSHELRTPMNSILGFAQLLQMGELNPPQKKGVNHIMHSGRHLLDLINEVLDISRIESGRLSLSMEPVQLSAVIMEMVDTVMPQVNARRITLRVETGRSDLFVRADRQRLKQVVLNFVTNAVKYNQDGGGVDIRMEPFVDEARGSMNKVYFVDNGPGIHPNDLPKLFKPFERIGADKSTIEGSGLGLSVVKKLLDAMGGLVGVESVPGQGSSFWFALPSCEKLADASHADKEPFPPTPDSPGKVGTILYIEDNPSNIELVEQVLINQRPDIRLVTRFLGRQALDAALETQPDLILLDLNLPDIHGSQVFEHLKIDPRTRHIPVVVISADAMPNQLERLMKAGVRDYLTKPLDIQAFLGVVDGFFVK